MIRGTVSFGADRPCQLQPPPPPPRGDETFLGLTLPGCRVRAHPSLVPRASGDSLTVGTGDGKPREEGVCPRFTRESHVQQEELGKIHVLLRWIFEGRWVFCT